jgi:hypothetical protein
MLPGLIEIISPNFVVGWARVVDQQSSHVYASLGGKILGWAVADIVRNDLRATGTAQKVAAGGSGDVGRGFAIIFSKPLALSDFAELKVTLLEDAVSLPRGNRMHYDRRDPLQLFVLGSPRSGTSEMGLTLATVLELPWVGEGHAAPSFHGAAIALSGETAPPGGLSEFMRKNALGAVAQHAMRQAYYWTHAASSFLDKTPGVGMIRAAPFLAKSFPAAKFVFMRRNGISNVLSRMKKFGGPFQSHCQDWAAAMSCWKEVRGQLPHYVEIEQEVMLEKPERAAAIVAEYLGLPADIEKKIEASMRDGTLERTGAGIGRNTLEATGWSGDQIVTFRKVCGQTMADFDYELE